MTDSFTGAPARRPRDLHERDRRLNWHPNTRVLQWLVIALLVAGGVSWVVKGADGPQDPYFRAVVRQPVAGFGEIAYRSNHAPEATRCALLAQTSAQHGLGLANRQDLSGYDGMLFVFVADTDFPFSMRNIPIPLSLAWFDSGGRFMSSTDLEPCPDRLDCPSFPPPGPFRYALEVGRGGLGELGIGPGAVISVGGPCA